MTFTTNDLILKAIEIEDALKEIEEEQAAVCKPYTDALTAIKASLLAELQELNVGAGEKKKNLHAENGSCAYLHTSQKVKVDSFELFLSYIRANERWDMVSLGALIDPVREHLATHSGSLPPGLKLDTFTSCKIRRRK